ncbi:MAG TPA: hypothetical protein ENN63_07505 [Bacteroidetes bacterium]|nr:hypothetical protein [Bacteroidota bacterium]
MRDPRWERTGDSSGEDLFLVSQITGGFIRGMMGYYDTYLKAVPCGKRFFFLSMIVLIFSLLFLTIVTVRYKGGYLLFQPNH